MYESCCIQNGLTTKSWESFDLKKKKKRHHRFRKPSLRYENIMQKKIIDIIVALTNVFYFEDDYNWYSKSNRKARKPVWTAIDLTYKLCTTKQKKHNFTLWLVRDGKSISFIHFISLFFFKNTQGYWKYCQVNKLKLSRTSSENASIQIQKKKKSIRLVSVCMRFLS